MITIYTLYTAGMVQTILWESVSILSIVSIVYFRVRIDSKGSSWVHSRRRRTSGSPARFWSRECRRWRWRWRPWRPRCRSSRAAAWSTGSQHSQCGPYNRQRLYSINQYYNFHLCHHMLASHKYWLSTPIVAYKITRAAAALLALDSGGNSCTTWSTGESVDGVCPKIPWRGSRKKERNKWTIPSRDVRFLVIRDGLLHSPKITCRMYI